MNGLQTYEDADIHICGMCRAQFSDVELFIQHKKHKCPVRLARQKETQGDDARNLKSEVPVPFHSVQEAPVPFQPVQEASVPFQSVQEAPVPYQNDQYSQSMLPVMDDSPIQGSVSDKVSVQLSQDGATIGYFPVAPSENSDAGIGPITQHQYVILPCPDDDQVICSPHDQTYSQTDSLTYSQTDSQTYSQTDSQTYPQTDSQTYPQTDSQTDSQIYSQTDSQTYPQTDSQIYSQTDSQTFPHTDSQTYSQTDSQTYPQTDSQTYPQTNSQIYSQTDSQTYSTLETVYTLNSHTLHQSTDQIPSSIQTEEQINYYKRNVDVESVIYTSEPFQETDNNRIEEQSTDCITNDSSQEPVCYSTNDENLQPVNYSKSNLLQDEKTVINLLQTDQPMVIQNFNNLNLQQTGIPVDRLSGTLQSQSDETEKQSILREHLIGAENTMVVKTITPKILVKNVYTPRLPPTSRTKNGMVCKRTIPKPHNNPAKFQYTICEIGEAPKPSPAKKPNKTPLEKKFRCKFDNCSYRTAYLKDLERHSRTHTGDKPYKCTRCKKAFSRTDKLTLHMRYHLDDRVFKCNFCNYSAVENGSLKKHMKMHLDERPFSCQVCPYKSRSSSQLQIHLRTHTGDRPYGCKLCEAVFKVSSDLHRHIRIHTGEKPFRCDIKNCTYRCAVKSNLKSHYQRNHSQVIEHKCTTCDFTTSSRRALFEHKKTHKSIPELTCSICGYQCSNKSALRNHLRIHSDDDPFGCTYCEYKSVQLGNVQAHMTRKHPNMIPKKLNRKRWSKINKPEISMKMKEVEAHGENTEKKHSVKNKIQPKCLQSFKCDRCPAAFVREDSLKCHLKQHNDSSLSTAYTVLNLQQPVINTPNSQPPNFESAAAISASEQSNRDVAMDKRNSLHSVVPENQALHLQETKENLATLQGQAISGQSQLIPSQAVALGINDILMAAGMSGLNSAGNSPTSKLQMTGDIVAQDLSLNSGAGGTGATDSSPTILGPGNKGLKTAVVGQSQNDVPAVHVMQNISLPYIRLPNGQILILTGQTSMNQMINQPDGPIQCDSGLITNTVDMQSQLLTQPIDSQQQIVQCAADSTVSTPPPQISAPQSQDTILTQPGAITVQDGALTQQGAIPIQIILPSDSQQAVPIVSQLLNSVMNRSSSDGQNQGSVMLQGINSTSGSDHVQNFVLQIPTQSGMSRDSSGNLTESQSFVLQIPGSSSFN